MREALQARRAWRREPDVVIHQLTDLPRVLDDEAQLAAALRRATPASASRARAIWSPRRSRLGAALHRRRASRSPTRRGKEPHVETDPLNLVDGPRLP